MRKILYLFAIFVWLSISVSLAQDKSQMRNFFIEAESHYLYNEYEKANEIYMVLNQMMPENANIQYKIGNCYLHIPHEKTKAIPFLQSATANAEYGAKVTRFNEKRAPLDVYFSLGNAYRISNNLDKAILTYAKFKELLSGENRMINSDFIDQEIMACKNAKKLMETSLDFTKKTLGEKINIVAINHRPAVSGDGNTMVYTCDMGEENSIYMSQKVSGKWSPPTEITSQLSNQRDISSSSLNYDGTQLFIYKMDDFVGNIYVSNYSDGTWNKIMKLNNNINTKYYESHAIVSKDGNTLFFTSNREEGEGGLDIYRSELQSDGTWGPAKNLGTSINTPFNEDTPFLTNNDSILFFSSEGHYTIGGYDIFKAKKKNDAWQKPENIGYPINTTDDDLFFQPLEDGTTAYYSMLTGYKEKEIFKINLFSKKIELVFEIRGIISVPDSTFLFNEDFPISLIDTVSNDTIDVSYPNKSTGLYNFVTSTGDYELIYEGIGYSKQTKKLFLDEDSPESIINIDVRLEPDSTYVKKKHVPIVDFSKVTVIESIDSSLLITDVETKDVNEIDEANREILYYTVQLMALYNPVDISFFIGIDNVKVLYGKDLFYRYTTGRLKTIEEAEQHRTEIINMGYPEEIFIKKVYQETIEE
ncbi:MAG: PD40 domain-containing protein [Bacteroidetes bacterium]|nr:PD40 domain-containing protein [Bacteroidota bacterium]